MIKVVQISDTHLFEDPKQELYSVNTRNTLSRIIEHINRDQESIDCVLVTGDLVHDESSSGYHVLQDMVQQLQSPAYYLPGNHDDATLIQSILSNSTENGICVFNKNAWKVILLDSSIHGQVEGKLIPETLAVLEQELSVSNDYFILIAVHHHVIDIESQWLDELNLTNRDEFMAIIEKYPNVKTVINGHIHQEFDEVRNNIRYLGVPSTCFQFKPRMDRAEIDRTFSGYRLLELGDSGQLETHVVYIENDIKT